VWSILKDRLNKRPSSSLGQGNSELGINSFIKAIFEEWQIIPQEAIDNCILSIPRRYTAVVEANSWFTKY
jgi:hypothetical protein